MLMNKVFSQEEFGTNVGNGNPERIAYDLATYVRANCTEQGSYNGKDTFLDLFAECLVAANGQRKANAKRAR